MRSTVMHVLIVALSFEDLVELRVRHEGKGHVTQWQIDAALVAALAILYNHHSPTLFAHTDRRIVRDESRISCLLSATHEQMAAHMLAEVSHSTLCCESCWRFIWGREHRTSSSSS